MLANFGMGYARSSNRADYITLSLKYSMVFKTLESVRRSEVDALEFKI